MACPDPRKPSVLMSIFVSLRTEDPLQLLPSCLTVVLVFAIRLYAFCVFYILDDEAFRFTPVYGNYVILTPCFSEPFSVAGVVPSDHLVQSPPVHHSPSPHLSRRRPACKAHDIILSESSRYSYIK